MRREIGERIYQPKYDGGKDILIVRANLKYGDIVQDSKDGMYSYITNDKCKLSKDDLWHLNDTTVGENILDKLIKLDIVIDNFS